MFYSVSYLVFTLLVTYAHCTTTNYHPNCKPPSAPLRNYSLDKLMGRWYFADVAVPFEPPSNTNVCIDVTFTQINETSFKCTSDTIPQGNKDVELLQSGAWKKVGDPDGVTSWLIYLSEDGSKVGLACCTGNIPGHCYGLYSRRLPLTEDELLEANQAMTAAGLKIGGHYHRWHSTGTCGMD